MDDPPHAEFKGTGTPAATQVHRATREEQAGSQSPFSPSPASNPNCGQDGHAALLFQGRARHKRVEYVPFDSVNQTRKNIAIDSVIPALEIRAVGRIGG